MHIAILIASRGRPEMLKTVVRSLDWLKSGNNHITYAIYHDERDPATAVAVDSLKPDVNIHAILGERPTSLGAPMNVLAASLPDADCFCVLADDVLPLSQHWDVGVQLLMMDYPVVAWHDINDPNHPTYPIIGRKWYEAAGSIYPELFPFWFNDTWLFQVYIMAKGCDIICPRELMLGGNRGKTMGLRDFEVWADLFRVTRKEREDEAKAIADKMGLEFSVTEAMTKAFDKYDTFLQKRKGLFEALLADGATPPAPGYEAMLERAKARIAAQ